MSYMNVMGNLNNEYNVITGLFTYTKNFVTIEEKVSKMAWARSGK